MTSERSFFFGLSRQGVMKIPQTINLRTDKEEVIRQLTDGRAGRSIVTLPIEIHLKIYSYLYAVDKVCFGLTCKTLALSYLGGFSSLPPLFLPRKSFEIPDLSVDSCFLSQRLAHGWIDKKRFRYCWKCHLILPRTEVYFRQRMAFRKKPMWSVKVNAEKDRWLGMSKTKRYDHLIKTWCEAEWEDSSCLSCDACRNKDFVELTRRHPVECPLCLEKELTYTYKRPHRRLYRPAMVEICRHVVSLLSSLVVLLFYLIWFLVDAPFYYGRKLYLKVKAKVPVWKQQCCGWCGN